MTHTLTAQVHCAGWYRLEKTKIDTDGQPIESTRTVVADWFPNLITDAGLDLMATASNWLSACHVGSGSAAPAVSDTRLQARIGSSSTRQDSKRESLPDQGYAYLRQTYRFTAGTATGNISELGIADSTNGDSYTLLSRALVLDANGQPTTITVLADEVLDVTYEFRLYAPTTDGSGGLTLGGSGTTHRWTSRACDLGRGSTPWDDTLGQAWRCHNEGYSWFGRVLADAQLLDRKANPTTADSRQATSVNRQAYTAGSHTVDFAFFCDLNDGNVSGGIGWVGMSGSFGAYQWVFEPKIAKTAAQKLTLNLRLSWARQENIP